LNKEKEEITKELLDEIEVVFLRSV